MAFAILAHHDEWMGTRHRRTCQTPLHLAFVLQSGFTNLTDLQPPVLLPQMASPAAFLMEEIMMESELVDLSACPMGWEGHDPSWPPPPPHPCQIDMCSLQNGMYGTHATEDECLAAECADAGAIRDTTTDPSCVPTERRYPSLVLPSSCNVAGYAAEPSTGCAMSYDVSWLVQPPTRPLVTIAVEIFRANVPLLCVPSSTANHLPWRCSRANASTTRCLCRQCLSSAAALPAACATMAESGAAIRPRALTPQRTASHSMRRKTPKLPRTTQSWEKLRTGPWTATLSRS